MTKEDILRMAREAGLMNWNGNCVLTDQQLERLTNLVANAEREACAKLCEQWDASHPYVLAKAIRARGTT